MLETFCPLACLHLALTRNPIEHFGPFCSLVILVQQYLLYMVFGAKCNYTYTRPITGASSLVTGSVVMVNMVDMVVIAAATRPR